MPMAITKHDLPHVRERWPEVRGALRADGYRPIAVSAVDGTGLEDLRGVLATALEDVEAAHAPAADAEAGMRIHRFDPLEEGWQVVAEAGGLRIRGGRIERAAAQTDFENPESRERFQRTLERLGIEAELRRRGAQSGTSVRIGRVELEWADEV
jgi:GTP-binding protein